MVTPVAQIYLARALLAARKTRDALREFERATSSATPASAELATARAYESLARLNLGDLDGASSAAAAQSSGSPARGHQDTTTAMTPLALTAEQHASVAITSLSLAAQLRGDLSMALQVADDMAGPGRQRHAYPIPVARADPHRA